uniref:Uncharacterized protein n=1 Tax=Meloidogyne enterolobii TaxID=390850 RepID=A0A6V7WGH5_MELEN|nr:unnamed protein product [Meloidogyne enterolobii]
MRICNSNYLKTVQRSLLLNQQSEFGRESIFTSITLEMAVAYFIIRCISILLVFGFVVQCEEVGLGKHVLVNETIIELKNNTRIAENDTDLEQYRKLPGACDVTLDNDGNIILWYSKNSSTTEFGCSVDLVTTKKEQILLEFGISHSGNLSDCVTKKRNHVPDNMISFSYSMNGSEFEELKNGPKHGDVNDCSDKDKCNAGRGTCVQCFEARTKIRTRTSYSYSYLVRSTSTSTSKKMGQVRKYEYEYEAKKSEKYEVRGLSTSSYFSYLVLIGKLKEICLIFYIVII